jgi:hypothetical protein
MSDELLDEIEAIERQGWDALCAGTGADFYGGVMTSDGLMVLADGSVRDRDQVVASLRDAPAWKEYELRDLRLVTTGPESAAIGYRVTARRDDQPPVTAVMTSQYVLVTGSWRLALHTQTPLPAG